MPRRTPLPTLFPYTTLFRSDDRAAREEIFGPVACVIPFSDEAEAVRLANDTIYGLSGSIWTREDRKSTRLNSSHVAISYAVFCLKKKNRIKQSATSC